MNKKSKIPVFFKLRLETISNKMMRDNAGHLESFANATFIETSLNLMPTVLPDPLSISRSSAARQMEAKIDKLRASTLERQALRERVLGYLSDGSRLRAERCRKLRGDLDDISLVSSKSSSSLAWISENGPCDAVWKRRTDTKDDWSKFRTTMNSKERRMAQELRAKEVLRRKR